jgi:hypothetical protein
VSDDTITTTNGVLRICCADERNLIVQPQTSDLVVKTCRECDRNHYEFSVDPALIGLRGAGL